MTGEGLERPLLIRGGRVVTMVDGTAEHAVDLLVRNGRIAAIGPALAADDADILDARGMIVLPGFVDAHRHVWQTQLRTVATDWSLFNYFTQMRLIYAAFYQPDDVYLGNLIGALEALNAGITTIVDHCHILHSPEHTDEAIRGLDDAGIRGLFCYGLFATPSYASGPVAPSLPPDWRRTDAQRIRQGRFADNTGRLRMGFAPAEIDAHPYATNVDEIVFARSLGAARISCHVAMGAYDTGSRFVEHLGRDGLLAEDLLFVHGSALTDGELAFLRDHGAGIVATPETELQMGMGFPVAIRARDAGVRTALGIDIVSNYAGDMFAQMRLCLQAARALENQAAAAREEAPRTLRVKAADVLRLATVGGAEALGMAAQIGSLAVGKAADVVVVRTDAIHLTPAPDAVGAVVLNAHATDVDTVVVGGRVVKRGGRLVGVDWPALAARLQQSSARIRAGFATVDLAGIEAMMAGVMARVR